MSDEVINIYQNASNEHRRLTEEENAVVLANQNELINVQLSKLNYSAKEKKAITKAMNGELEALNSQQLTKALEVTEKWIKAENKSYQKLKSGLKKKLMTLSKVMMKLLLKRGKKSTRNSNNSKLTIT